MSKFIHEGPLFAHRNSYRTPLVLAHRGGNTLAPQNSLPAFLTAAQRGVWAIETDVRLTRDGRCVCIHDPVADTMTNGTGEIKDFTFDELMKLRINRGVGADTLPEDELTIPTFDQYLDLCMRYGVVPFIELKTDDGCEPVMQALRRRSLESYAVISSARFEHLEQARAISDRVFIHHIFSKKEYIDRLYDLGYAGMSFKIKNVDDVPEGLVGDVHEAGLRVCIRAAETPEVLRRMIDMGLDYQPSNKLYGYEIRQ